MPQSAKACEVYGPRRSHCNHARIDHPGSERIHAHFQTLAIRKQAGDSADRPGPGHLTRPGSADDDDGLWILLWILGLILCGGSSTGATKTESVDLVVRIDPAADGGTQVVGIAAERTAPQHARAISIRITFVVRSIRIRIVQRTHPFPHIAAQVQRPYPRGPRHKAPHVCRAGTPARPNGILRIPLITPGISPPIWPPRRVLPFGFGRQAHPAPHTVDRAPGTT